MKNKYVFAGMVLFLSVIGWADDPLISKSDISYVGAFRLPPGTDPSNALTYGGTGVGYNPVNHSLFIVGHDWYQRICEVSIPAPSISPYDSLPTATLLQSCMEVTKGALYKLNPGDPNPQKIGGLLAYNGRLIVSAYSYYDGGCTQKNTHGVLSSMDFNSSFSGFFPMKALAIPRALAGYMGLIPSSWQARLGGPALTGLGGAPIIGCTSSGPAMTVFNPDEIGPTNPIPGTTLATYPNHDGPLSDKYFHWMNSTTIRGVAFPEGSRSVLFVGSQGDTRCYGGTECNDPCDSAKGVHSAPYHIKIWAMDANDLLAVKVGTKDPTSVAPYDVWTLSEIGAGCARIASATFDPTSGQLFIVPVYGEKPIVHVYKVASPVPPTESLIDLFKTWLQTTIAFLQRVFEKIGK